MNILTSIAFACTATLFEIYTRLRRLLHMFFCAVTSKLPNSFRPVMRNIRRNYDYLQSERIKLRDSAEAGDVPGWVLVVLMTTGLVTAIWTIAAPRLSTILRNSLDAMNGIR